MCRDILMASFFSLCSTQTPSYSSLLAIYVYAAWLHSFSSLVTLLGTTVALVIASNLRLVTGIIIPRESVNQVKQAALAA